MRRTTIILALTAFALTSFTSAADPPETINYQGVLRDSADKPVSDGSYAMVFRFYSVAGPGGSAILQDAQNVTVTGGLFSAEIGENPSDGPGPGVYDSLAKVFADFSDLYVEVEVDGELLTPRIHLASAGFALNARRVRGREIISDGPVDLYVDDLNGDDANDGLSPASAKKTIQGAIRSIPVVLGGDVIVHIANGTYREGVVIGPRFGEAIAGWITLIGNEEDPSSVVIQPPLGGGVEEGVIVLHPASIIRGVTVTGFPFMGVEVILGGGLTLEQCRILGNGNGARAEQSASLELVDCTITDNPGFGVGAWLNAWVKLSGSVEIAGNGVGADCRWNSTVTFQTGPCTISGNDLDVSKNSTIEGYGSCTLSASQCSAEASTYASCLP